MATPIVIIDTREQKPYSFPPDWLVIHRALPSGDYSLLGMEDRLAIERKSENDLLGCIFTPRFERELQRLADYEWAFLVMETNWASIKRNKRFQGNPASVFGKIQAMALKYKVMPLFLDSRATSQLFTQGILSKAVRYGLNEIAA